MLMGTIYSLNPPNQITGRLRLLFSGTEAFFYINFRKDDEHMKTKCKRLLSLLLVFVLVLGLMPSVHFTANVQFGNGVAYIGSGCCRIGCCDY